RVAAEIALLNHGLKVQADEHSVVGEFFPLADGRRQLRGSPTSPHDVYSRWCRNTPLHWTPGHGQRLQHAHVAAEHVDAGTAHVAEDKEAAVEFLRYQQRVAGLQRDVVLHVLTNEKIVQGQGLVLPGGAHQTGLGDRSIFGESSGSGQGLENGGAGPQRIDARPHYLAQHRDTDLAELLDGDRNLRIANVEAVGAHELAGEVVDG